MIHTAKYTKSGHVQDNTYIMFISTPMVYYNVLLVIHIIKHNKMNAFLRYVT